MPRGSPVAGFLPVSSTLPKLVPTRSLPVGARSFLTAGDTGGVDAHAGRRARAKKAATVLRMRTSRDSVRSRRLRYAGVATGKVNPYVAATSRGMQWLVLKGIAERLRRFRARRAAAARALERRAQRLVAVDRPLAGAHARVQLV